MKAPTIKFPVLLVLCTIFAATAAHAQLKWESQTIELTAAPGDKDAVAHFKFENVGSTAIKIDSATPSCGCTTASLSKNDFAPHEMGEVTATFNIGDRHGQQEKAILVKSNDPGHPDTILTLKVNIPEIAQITPSFLRWQRGDPLKPKEISVKILNGYPVHALTVVPSDRTFLAKVETVTTDKEYRITVTPPDTTSPKGALLTVATDFPAASPKKFFVNLWLK